MWRLDDGVRVLRAGMGGQGGAGIGISDRHGHGFDVRQSLFLARASISAALRAFATTSSPANDAARNSLPP